MVRASTLKKSMSPELLKIAERARREPEARFHSLAHLMDVAALRRAYHKLKKYAAVGVDKVTKEEYGQKLDSNLKDLHERLKTIDNMCLASNTLPWSRSRRRCSDWLPRKVSSPTAGSGKLCKAFCLDRRLERDCSAGLCQKSQLAMRFVPGFSVTAGAFPTKPRNLEHDM